MCIRDSISTDGKIMTNKHVVSLLDGEKEKAEKVKETIQMAIVKRYPNNAGAVSYTHLRMNFLPRETNAYRNRERNRMFFSDCAQ